MFPLSWIIFTFSQETQGQFLSRASPSWKAVFLPIASVPSWKAHCTWPEQLGLQLLFRNENPLSLARLGSRGRPWHKVPLLAMVFEAIDLLILFFLPCPFPTNIKVEVNYSSRHSWFLITFQIWATQGKLLNVRWEWHLQPTKWIKETKSFIL